GMSQVTRKVAPPAITAITSNRMMRDKILILIQTSKRLSDGREYQYADENQRCKNRNRQSFWPSVQVS
ncbi:hypothetical protein, partial [Thalassospira sp.]|uniref:hypothetical protein n=1 Tax=Thalassospira sp. TaxID=1912094 RepID=UPI00257B997F